MSRFPQLKASPDHPALTPLYADIIAAGFGLEEPINWFTAQSLRPDILQGTWALVKSVLVEGLLPPTLKQMIAMVVSRQNACRYCEVTHTGAMEAMGVPPEVIESCARDPDLAQVQEPHRSVLRFALQAARDPNALSNDDFEHLESLGLSREEVLEVGMMAAFTNFINTWADISGVAVDGQEDNHGA